MSWCSGVSRGARAGVGVVLGAVDDPGLTSGHFADTFKGVSPHFMGLRGRDHDIATERNASVATGTESILMERSSVKSRPVAL